MKSIYRDVKTIVVARMTDKYNESCRAEGGYILADFFLSYVINYFVKVKSIYKYQYQKERDPKFLYDLKIGVFTMVEHTTIINRSSI